MTARRLIATAVALWLTLCVGAAAAADSDKVIVRDATLDSFPRVGLQVALPGGLGGAGTPTFKVMENGRTVEVVESEELNSDPVDVVLVLDTSGSMQGESLDAAKAAAGAFIRELQPESKVGIIAFSDRPSLVSPISPQAEALLVPALNRLEASGETALYDALGMAASESSRAEVKRPVVVLLSDGGDTVSRSKLDSSIKRLKAAKAPVLVVALPSAEADYAVLRSIAKQTGGRFATVSKADQLTAFYQDLARQLQTSWRLTYVSRRPSTKDLEVEVSASAGKSSATGLIVLPNPLFVPVEPGAQSAIEPAPPASMITLVGAVGLVFVAMFSLVVAIALFLIRPRTALDHLRYYDQLQGTGEAADEAQDYSGRVTSSLIGAVDYVAGKRGIKRFAYEQLERAGLPLRPTEYITIHLLAVMVVGIVTQLLIGNFLISAIVIVIASLVPLALLDMKANSRRTKFEEQLPDVLNLVAGSLRAGWGLQQAVDLVVEQMAPPVSAEFARAQTEIRLGRPVEQALESVAQRTQSLDFSWAVAAIGIQRDVGGNLAEVLDVVAKTIRDRTALKRQISALTAEGRLSAWILLALPFVLIVLLLALNPTYLNKLYTTTPGLVMLAIGVVLLIVGAIWMRRVVTIEV